MIKIKILSGNEIRFYNKNDFIKQKYILKLNGRFQNLEDLSNNISIYNEILE